MTTRELWVFLHGTPLTPEVWRPIAERVRSRGALVLCPSLDSRGDAATHAARIAEQLQENAVVTVVGHSFGGQVAIDLALILARENRLAGLGVVCSRATPYPPFDAAARLAREGDAPDPEAAIARWFTADERHAGSPIIDYAKTRLSEADPKVWADALLSVARYDRESELATISAATVFVAAEHDLVSPPEVMEAMAASMSNSRFHVLRGTSHMGAFLRPDVTSALLLDGLSCA
jgi:pimeloyl-ACP methyl ester carboxylesterase